MNSHDDHFLDRLYEEPRPEFAAALWDQLASQEVSVHAQAADSPTQQKEEPVLNIADRSNHRDMLRRFTGKRPAAHEQPRSRSYRLSWALPLVIEGLGLVLILILFSNPGKGSIHYASIGTPLTPTVSPTQTEIQTPTLREQTVSDALANTGPSLPETAFDLGDQDHPVEFKLTNQAPAVTLRVDGRVGFRIPITLELTEYPLVKGEIAIRISRYNGNELQPLMIYNLEQLVSLPFEFYTIYVDQDGKADLVVELLTPLLYVGREQLGVFGSPVKIRAYQGGFAWTPDIYRNSAACAYYPTYCVRLAGGGTRDFTAFEAAYLRVQDQPGIGSRKVVRGLSSDGAPVIGDPAAPVRLAVILDFSCPHCAEYYLGDLNRIIRDYVLTGQVQLEIHFTSEVGGKTSELAAQAALAAGEQGEFWEMTEALFKLAQTEADPFTLPNIRAQAEALGMRADKLVDTINSGRYLGLLAQQRTLFDDLGTQAVPTVALRTGTGNWQQVIDWHYNALSAQIIQTIHDPASQTVMISITPDQTWGRITIPLATGSQVVLHFDLKGLTPEAREAIGTGYKTLDQVTFSGTVASLVAPLPQSVIIPNFVMAVPLPDVQAILRLIAARVPVTLEVPQS